LLAKVYTKNDVQKVVESAFLKGEIASEEQSFYNTLLTAICSHPELSAYYEASVEVWNEREILHQGKLIRPDRVVLINQIATVIDYKTGEASERYHQQINEYAQAVEALGFSVEKKIIVYIQNLEITIVNL
jgi:CRISPR/Cas system-associated exonuclease Cas4 (RecB family)